MNEPLETAIDPQGFVSMKVTGDITGKERLEALKKATALASEVIKSLYDTQGKKVESILDMTGFSGKYDPEAITIMSQFAARNKPFMEKAALFGLHEFAKMAAEVAVALSGRDNIRFFNDKEAALSWLKTS